MNGRILIASLVQFLCLLSVLEAKSLQHPHSLGEQKHALPARSDPALRMNFPDTVIYRPYPAKWVKWDGEVPNDAFWAGIGPDNKKVYIGILQNETRLITGTVKDGVLTAPLWGGVFRTEDFYILTKPKGTRLSWKPWGREGKPTKALVGGVSGGGIGAGDDFYIAKTLLGAETVVGIYYPPFGSYFPDGDVELDLKSALVLCAK